MATVRDKELKKFIKVAKGQGWRVERKTNHWMFYPSDKSKGIVTVSCNKIICVNMIKSDLRKSGLKI